MNHFFTHIFEKKKKNNVYYVVDRYFENFQSVHSVVKTEQNSVENSVRYCMDLKRKSKKKRFKKYIFHFYLDIVQIDLSFVFFSTRPNPVESDQSCIAVFLYRL